MLARLLSLAKRLYFVLRNLRSFLTKEHELHGWPDSWTDLRMLAAGFHSDKQYLYELGADGRPLPAYVGDFERLMLRRLNEPYAAFLDHKALFAQVFGTQFRVPTDHGLIRRGTFLPFTDDLEVAPTGAALRDPSLPERLVLKRVGGGGGKDILLVTRREHDRLEVNGEPSTIDVLVEQLGMRTYVVTDLLTQGAYANNLFPHAINTVRVVTMRDDEGPFVAFAVQRIGNQRSRPTDNLNRGGLAALVDLDSGTLGPARQLEADRRPEAYTHHPDTGAPIAGQVVPHWTAITALLLEAMEAFPGLRYVGWDVVVGDDEDQLLVLEGNSYPGVQVAQLHHPLRNDPRTARFFDAVTTRTAA